MDLILALAICGGIGTFVFFMLIFVSGGNAGIIFLTLIMGGITVGLSSLYKNMRNKANAEKLAREKAKKKEEERWNSLTQDEKDAELNSQISSSNRYCPSCHRTLVYYKNGSLIDKWVLKGTEKRTETVFDSAYSIGGHGTVNFKERPKTIYHYACPNCGFTRTQEF